MNKTQLVDAIAARANITKVDAKRALDALIEVTGGGFATGRQDRVGRLWILFNSKEAGANRT